ncbi:MAG: chemotaxis protein CheA [Deltaproteobacteria bacterium]|nr:chemotaxis protein CheA [Deltaproteobacteria bacterium]
MADPSLFQDFIPEAVEALEEMETGLLQLEAQPGNKQVINTIFRAAHTIKGSAEYLGLESLSTLAHKLESLLETFRHGDKVPDGPTLDVLMASKDRMVRLVGDLDASQEERTPVDDLVGRLEELSLIPAKAVKPKKADPVKPPPKKAAPKKAAPEATVTEASMDDLGELDSLLDDDVLEGGPKKAASSAPARPVDAAFASDSPLMKDALAEMDAFATLEEEYDKELFSIFEEHLKEQLALLAATVKRLAEGGGEEGCLKALETVEALKSSAGYMDYQKLVALYDEWKAALEGFRRSFPLGDRNLVGIIGIQAGLLLSHTASVPKEPVAEDAGEATEGFDLASLVGQAAPAPEAPIRKTAPPAVSSPAEPLFEDLAPAPSASDNQGLFDELDNVFDPLAAQAPVDVAVADPFADDFEESLSRGAVVPPRTPAPKKTFSPVPADRPQPGPEAPPPIGAPPAPRAAGKPPAPPAAEPFVIEPLLKAALEDADAAEILDAEPEKAVPDAAPEPAPADSALESASAPSAEPRQPAQEMAGFGQDDLVTERIAKQSLRVDATKVDNLMNQVGELVVSRASYGQLYYDMRQFQQRLHEMRIDSKELKAVRELTFRLSEATVALGRVANDLQEGVMKVRMLPISQLFNRYPRLVRDLAHDTGKKVHLEVKGEDTELDKMVIEEIANPLVHIIRNAVDHGIETVAERLRAGKPETAVVKLESYHESNHVVVEITDDGRGINTDRIRETALMKGFATREELDRIAGRELISFIMKPGFSTAASVTKTSGRGVGMDVVKKNIEKLNGTVEIESKVGQGTRVRIKIPLTLAIIQALLVRVGNEIFTLPLSVVEETLSSQISDIATIEGMEVIQMRDRVLPLLRLTDIFHLKSKNTESGKIYVVVVNTGMRDVGLVVDSLIGQEEVVIKPLVDYLQENCGFSGATILGDGRISLILDVYQMVNLSVARVASARGLLEATLESKSLAGVSAKDAGSQGLQAQ